MNGAVRIDDLDRDILNALMTDARVPYAEMAKRFNVSPATVHVRVEKMRASQIITGTEVIVNPKLLGYDVCCFREKPRHYPYFDR